MEKPIQEKNRPSDSHVLPDELYLPRIAEAFLIDCKARNLTPKTLRFYRMYLTQFVEWAESQAVKSMYEVTPNLLRTYFLYLQEQGHNPGGVDVYFRSIRALLRWYYVEFDPREWRDPLQKIKRPKVDVVPLEPVPMGTIKALLATCEAGTFTGERDRSILLFLLDTGVRAGELIALDRPDVDTITGDVLIRKSKSRKPRTVFLGRQARKALRVYLRLREDLSIALFVNVGGERLKVAALRQIMRRRSKRAGVKTPNLHSFRRANALALLRAGVDLLSISRLLGHSDLSLLKRYINQTSADLRDTHAKASPVDGM